MKVKVYSTPVCPYCETLKTFLKKNNVDFEDVDVSEDKKVLQEMKEKSGQMNVPVVEIGDEVITGFDKKKLKELLDLE